MRVSEEAKKLTLGRVGSINLAVILVTLCLGLVMGGVLWSWGGSNLSPESEAEVSKARASQTESSGKQGNSFSVSIRKPTGPPRVDTGMKDPHGHPVTVSCSTCHATRKPNPDNKLAADLDEFHGTIEVAHSTISCLSCHNPNDYDSLRLADGTRVEYANVMTLCAQCHGPEMRDFEHGTHGGMNGYWDLKRGPQTKNNCVDCHNPHSPKFPSMQPTFKPKDRFLDQEQH